MTRIKSKNCLLRKRKQKRLENEEFVELHFAIAFNIKFNFVFPYTNSLTQKHIIEMCKCIQVRKKRNVPHNAKSAFKEFNRSTVVDEKSRSVFGNSFDYGC